MVVQCSILVRVSVCGGILTMTNSSWGENVITLLYYVNIKVCFVVVGIQDVRAYG